MAFLVAIYCHSYIGLSKNVSSVFSFDNASWTIYLSISTLKENIQGGELIIYKYNCNSTCSKANILAKMWFLNHSTTFFGISQKQCQLNYIISIITLGERERERERERELVILSHIFVSADRFQYYIVQRSIWPSFHWNLISHWTRTI